MALGWSPPAGGALDDSLTYSLDMEEEGSVSAGNFLHRAEIKINFFLSSDEWSASVAWNSWQRESIAWNSWER